MTGIARLVENPLVEGEPRKLAIEIPRGRLILRGRRRPVQRRVDRQLATSIPGAVSTIGGAAMRFPRRAGKYVVAHDGIDCSHVPPPQNMFRKKIYRPPDNIIAVGTVSTHPSAMLRIVESWSPDPLAAMVPATPEDSTWVVDTGRPYMSAAAIVPTATSSAAAP